MVDEREFFVFHINVLTVLHSEVADSTTACDSLFVPRFLDYLSVVAPGKSSTSSLWWTR